MHENISTQMSEHTETVNSHTEKTDPLPSVEKTGRERKVKNEMRNKTKCWIKRVVEIRDKGREVNPGKQYKETEMVWGIERKDELD